MTKTGIIYGINGPIVHVKGDAGFEMHEMVTVGGDHLVGEVIGLSSDSTTIQVYEETTGIKPGEIVEGTGAPVSATLAPGILNNIFDGIERPLAEIAKSGGAYISRGVNVDSLDTKKLWKTHITVKKGDRLYPGAIIAEVPETPAITHKVMIPPDMEGYVVDVVADGEYTISDRLLTLQLPDGTEKDITMTQKWPIRVPRPTAKRFPPSVPLITGQRILDTMFPLAKGGTAAIPGGFGTGKTMTQHQIAKWSDADIIIYIGCGERGNEMTQVLEEFSELIDPKSGNPLMDRTTLIANTSNMPVAAREASLYSGLTLAEYYRDMGYHVAIMADSTSRWAEALRELSGRLEEMPAEEGFPAYLASRLSAFYERAGMMQNLNGTEGSVSIIGAVSPPGRRLLRAGDHEHQAVCPLLLGPGQEPVLRQTFPGHPVADQLLRVPDGPGPLVCGPCGQEICGLPQPADADPHPGEQPAGDREADRKRRAAGRPEADAGDRPGDPGGIPAAERFPPRRHLRPHVQAVSDDGRDPLPLPEVPGADLHGHAHVGAQGGPHFRQGDRHEIRHPQQQAGDV